MTLGKEIFKYIWMFLYANCWYGVTSLTETTWLAHCQAYRHM